MDRRDFLRVAATTGTIGFLIPGAASAFYDPLLGEPHTGLPALDVTRSNTWALPVQPVIPETPPRKIQDLVDKYKLECHPAQPEAAIYWRKLETRPIYISTQPAPDAFVVIHQELEKLVGLADTFLGLYEFGLWTRISEPTIVCKDILYEAETQKLLSIKLHTFIHVAPAYISALEGWPGASYLQGETMSALMASARAVATNAGVDDVDDYAQLLKEQSPTVEAFLQHAGKPSEPCPDNPDPSASPEAQKAWVDAHSLKCFARQATPHHKKEMAHHIKRQKRRSNKPVSEADAEKLANSVVNQAANGDQVSVAASLLESRSQQ